MTAFDPSACTDFFTDLYDEAVSPAHRLVLWTARDKRSVWIDDISKVGEVLDNTSPNTDLYYGVCLQDHEAALKERRLRNRDENATLAYARGYAATTAVMPGLWLDLDIAGPGHEKTGLPKSQVDADRILAALPLDPTWIVETGGGTHVYWLWREPWVFESEEERTEAAALIRGWQQVAIDAATEMGFVVDSTHDLSRVLRPLGTINSKYGAPVRFRQVSDHRFNQSDFEDYRADPLPIRSATTRPSVEGLHEGMEPPAQKLMAMMNLAPKFAETWRRERREFPSQSEYDMSLAGMAARSGWQDDEIVALVVAHRRMHGEQLKLDRPGYYERLLGKAKSGMEADEAHERLSDRVEMVQTGDADIEDERDHFLRDVSTLLGFEIRRIIKFVTDPPQYRLVLQEGQIHLGGVESILNSSKFRASIAAVSGTLIQRFQGARWDPVAQAILQAVEELDLGSDSTAEGLVGEWMTEYLMQHRPSHDRVEAIGIRHPFIHNDGRVCIFLSEFRSWLGFHRDERLGRKQLATLLRTANSEPVTVNYTRQTDGKKTTCACWTVPASIAANLPATPVAPTVHDESESEVPF
jgi:hypothetical protein